MYLFLYDTDTVKKNTQTLTDASKEVGLEVNKENCRCVLLSHHQNAGQNHDITIAIRCFQSVAQLKYLGRAVTNQNLIQEEIKRRLNSGKASHHSVQNLLSFRLLSENIKIRICKTIMLPVVLDGCETRSLTLKEEHRLMMFQKRVLRTFGPKREEVTGNWRKLHNEALLTCTLLQV
jgi:hypothetical protein